MTVFTVLLPIEIVLKLSSDVEPDADNTTVGPAILPVLKFRSVVPLAVVTQ
jgi:hypothetical protein